MMKKWIAPALSLLLLCTLTVAVAEDTTAGTNEDTLIVYFTRVGISDFEQNVDAVSSASLVLGENGELIGNSAIAAGYIHDATCGDLFQIITEQRYPSAYRDTTDMAAIEQDDNARPALTSTVENMAQYSTIFLVYPNWWGDLPMGVYTFLESYDFSGKTIIPLCTHEGSGLGRTTRSISSTCPNATLLDGLAIRGDSVPGARESVNSWLSGLGFTPSDALPH